MFIKNHFVSLYKTVVPGPSPCSAGLLGVSIQEMGKEL